MFKWIIKHRDIILELVVFTTIFISMFLWIFYLK